MKKSRILIMTALVLLAVFAFSACKSEKPDEAVDVVYYTVTFNSAGGSEVTPRKVVKDGLVAMPEEPEREGYIFDCWLKGDEEWDFDYDKVTSDMTLTAKWIDAAHVYGYEVVESGVSVRITEIKTEYSVMRVPSVINGLKVVEIGNAVFEDTSSETVTSITVPDTVISVGVNSFKGCADVSITLEGALTTVGEGAFIGCNALKSVRFGEGLVTIPPQTFSTCTAITEIVLPDSLVTVDENAFEDCSALVTVVVGKGVEKIADSAFIGCDTLGAIYYRGTEVEFDMITVEGNNDAFDAANLYIYSENEPEESGEYWYFDDKGRIKIWK